jgi:hypothetical protein
VQRRTFQLGVPAAVQAIGDVSALLAEGRSRAAGGPARTTSRRPQKLHRLLIDVNCALDDAEALLEWPDLDARRAAARSPTRRWSRSGGRRPEQQLYDRSWRRRGARASATTSRSWSCTSTRCGRWAGRPYLPRPALDGRRHRLGGPRT